jgi:hypothetical protein
MERANLKICWLFKAKQEKCSAGGDFTTAPGVKKTLHALHPLVETLTWSHSNIFKNIN